MSEDRTPVSVIGLGDMGAALAGAFLAAGRPTTVWNRTAAKAEPLVAKGAVRAASAAEAVTAGPLVVVCLLNHDTVQSVLRPLAAELAGRTVVNLTNGTPEQARETAAWAKEHGIRYLDGGIMAVPPGIATPEAFILYSGEEAAFQEWRADLEVLGSAVYLGTDPGSASLHDLALLTALYGLASGAIQALALARTAGTELTAFTESLLMPWMRAMLEAGVPNYADQVARKAYEDNVVSNLAMQRTGFANILQTQRDQGVSTVLLEPLAELMDRRIADGHGEEDLSGLIELLG
ncbi:NAD(P)-binding domain-containing protein [Streptomyces sp. MST-110588]|uniref:NAD(P)-dependent oxidoreductase n=1 Tax=Streptomyces sp. MST-110588 TaxID=2833628 RepID=UPI001F5C57BF|nr:NAD(P)-binding domain-containing protein [Streptomyces sp. MST-110588]UNO40525.1 NAD(P)-dependent oxidoreductase [Streptomyces sp. MST-110588]